MDTQVRQEETLVWPWWTKRTRKERTRMNVCMLVGTGKTVKVWC